MKKFFILVTLSGILCVFAFSQSTTQTRPRVVVVPANTPPPETERVDVDIAPPPPLPVEDLEDVIKVNTSLVKLPVSVLDKNGRFIGELQQQDFQIYENGIEQQIEYFAPVENPFTVVLLLDLSPSTKYKISDIQESAIAFYDQLRSNDRLIIVAFSRNVKVLSDGNANYEQVRTNIRQAQFSDGTSLYEAVDFAMTKALRNVRGRKAIVLFSDGVDTSSRQATFNGTIKQAHSSEALLYSIRYNTFIPNTTGKKITYGIGGSPEEHARGKIYMRNLTEFGGGRIFEADTVDNLNNAYRSIAEELRKQYSIGYYPDIEGRPGEQRNIRVRVKKPNLDVRAKGSYTFGIDNLADSSQ